MNRIPRLLPLVGIAVGGVLAVKALAEVDVLPKLMAGAQALAEDAAPVIKAHTGKAGVSKPGKGVSKAPADKDAKAGDEAGSGETATSAPVASAATVAPPPVKVCAPSPAELAQAAGLSPAELQVLQSLGARRNQLDAREGDLDTQLKLLAAAEAKLDAKLQGLNGLKADLQALLGQTEQKGTAEIDRLVIVYSKMKPRDAAAVMIQLEDKVRLPVAAKLKEAQLAAILSQMPPAEAKRLTESLAHRYDKVQQLAQAATAPPSAAPPPAAAATEADPTAPAPADKPAVAKAKRPARKPAAKATAAAAATKAVAQAAATPGQTAPAPAAAAPTAAAAAPTPVKPAPTTAAAAPAPSTAAKPAA